MKICVYPGSFDPFTIGHLDVLTSAASLFDKVYVGVLNNTSKNPVFTPDERVEMIRKVIVSYSMKNVIADQFNGLLVEYAKKINAGYLIRGLRAITDFEYEFQIDAMNHHLAPDIKTVYFMSSPAHSFLSSSTIKEVVSLGADIKGLVPDCILDKITEKLNKK